MRRTKSLSAANSCSSPCPVALCALAAVLCLPLHAQIAKPPVAPVRPVTDTYFGQSVEDPYRWLEDQKSPESKAWMRGQADYTRAVLDSIPGRKQFAAEMERYLNAEDATITDVQLAGAFIFYRKRPRGVNQASLYVRKVSGGPERLLLDLPRLSTPEHHISMDQYAPSEDGKLVAVGLSPGGSEEQTAHFLETSTGRELPEKLERYEGGGFSPDGKTFYYLQLEKLGPDDPAVNKYKRPREYSHVIGTPAAEDKVVFGQGVSPDVEVGDYAFSGAFPVLGSKYVLAFIASGVETFRTVYVGDAASLTTHKGWKKVADLKDKVTDVALEGNDLYLVSASMHPSRISPPRRPSSRPPISSSAADLSVPMSCTRPPTRSILTSFRTVTARSSACRMARMPRRP
jgi:prolyl oligopeptidase